MPLLLIPLSNINDDLTELFEIDNQIIPQDLEYIVRKFTPSEIAALQGFPSDWHKNIHNIKEKMLPDTAAYRGYGNAVAVPCAEFVLSGCIAKIKGVIYE